MSEHLDNQICQSQQVQVVRPNRSHLWPGTNEVNSGMTAVSLCTQDTRHRILTNTAFPIRLLYLLMRYMSLSCSTYTDSSRSVKSMKILHKEQQQSHMQVFYDCSICRPTQFDWVLWPRQRLWMQQQLWWHLPSFSCRGWHLPMQHTISQEANAQLCTFLSKGMMKWCLSFAKQTV